MTQPWPHARNPGPDWEGLRTHTFRRLKETDAGLNLGPVDVLLIRCVLYHQLEQLQGDDVMIVYSTKKQLIRGLSPPPGTQPMALPTNEVARSPRENLHLLG